MALIGNPIISTDFPKDTFSGTGSATAFTMSIAPASVNAVLVIVSGVVQEPSTYTISGTTLTFSGAPPSGTNNISVRHLGVAGIPNVPSAASVVTSSIASGAITSGLLPAGTVLQVVNATYSTNNTTSSSTFTDTGLTASITPKFATSKILVVAIVAGISKGNNNARAAYNLVQNSTTLSTIEVNAAWDNTTGYNFVGGSGITYLASPATTSATVYKVQYASTTNQSYVGINADGGTSSITLMEIAG